MVAVAEWLRRKIVVLVYVGSIPTGHPNYNILCFKAKKRLNL